jgi:hypothetical protein
MTDWTQYLDQKHREAEAQRAALFVSKIGSSVPLASPVAVAAWGIGAGVTRRSSQRLPPTVARLVNDLLPDRSSRFEKRFKGVDEGTLKARRRAIHKRSFGSWSDMPFQLRYHYTEGERAALHIISVMVLKHGFCDLSIKEIADVAGVSRSTVKNALTEARKLGHIAVHYRKKDKANNLPNVVTIISAEWLNWLESLAVKKKSTLRKTREKQGKWTQDAPQKGAFERENADLFGINNHRLSKPRDLRQAALRPNISRREYQAREGG